MCEDLSRRRFGALALGAAGFAAIPLRASAGAVTALGLTCIDYRLVDDGVAFFDKMGLEGDWDQVALAGASLAAVSSAFPASNAAFWSHVDIAKTLHHIRRVIVLDHRDCGAYKVAFGKHYQGERKAETAQHRGVMLKMRAALKAKHPDLASEFYLMALDGVAERVL